MITVAQYTKFRVKRPYIVYVGRTTYVGRLHSRTFHELGNPFHIGVDGDRKEVVKKYQDWLFQEVVLPGKVQDAIFALAALYKEQGRLVLVCHCLNTDYLGGYDCHAQVIGRVVQELTAEME